MTIYFPRTNYLYVIAAIPPPYILNTMHSIEVLILRIIH